MASNIPHQPFRFDGEVAIVSGAGSRMAGEIGIGRATAILLARQGAKVALLDINVSWAEETKRMIDAEGGISTVIRADVTDESSCKDAVAKTVELFGTVTILVNVVGVGGAMGDATALDLAAWDRDMRINVTSMVLMARHVVPEMRKAGRGAIVNVSSVSGLLGGNPGLSYPTTKGAIVQMTRAMAAQHGTENIRVNCVCPGMVFTPMVRSRGISDDMRQARINQNMLKQEGTGWDVGYAILFLCSKEARWITGLIMPVDAGTTAGKSVADRPALPADVLAEQMTGIPNRVGQ
ncbi:putative oxidoreductase [Fonsecaea pedrosoi]|nr:putative oxidoreductase [Fonsecaea pedrosoi]